MSKVISGVISRTLAVSILATGISVLAASQTPAEAQDASAKATSAAALSATLSQRGRVSVIVRLSGQFQPEQGLAGPEGVEASAAPGGTIA